MRLISWNVNGLRSCLGKGFLDFCAFADADIICLQETKMRPEQAQLDLPGYRMFWNSADKAGYSGTAVFTRREPLSVTYDFGAVFACISFAHDNSASKTGFSCSSRFSYRSSGVSSANACSSLKSCEQYHSPMAAGESFRFSCGRVPSASSNFRRACAQQPTTRMFPGSLWYPWYPSACSQPEKPFRKASACSAFRVGWYSYSTMACFVQPLVRYSHM